MTAHLLGPFKDLVPRPFETAWRSPSNIALIKYWGKKGHQLPGNPSLSLTLKDCLTETKVKFSPASSLEVEFFLAGKKEERFQEKIKHYLETLQIELPWINKLSLRIESVNTFPHGAGMASSASGLSALALCLADYLHFLSSEKLPELLMKRASYLARLASGSACRSVYGGFTTWGESELSGSSDEYATPLEVHPELSHLMDTILVIDDKEKKISSREGHARMKEHAFTQARFAQAQTHFSQMVSALKTGDMDAVGLITESEALSLHAMMMASPLPYTLLKPHSLTAMEMVWDFRAQTKLPLYFTLDAGPNLHLIYPEIFKHKIHTFITHELAPLALNFIDDQRGEGPLRCSL